MARLSLTQIAKVIDAKTIGRSPEQMISRLLLDSRKAQGFDETLYFALRGKNHDGHRYVEDLVERGQQFFVLEKSPETVYEDCQYLIVKNSLEALQKLAAYVRKHSQATIIGITGSNAKTIVKEWLFQLLDTSYKVRKSPLSYNSQIGVPLSIWNLGEADEVGIFEAGISEPYEMAKLEKMIRPNLGIFTNLGSAHAINFSSIEQKLDEKLILFKNCEKLIYCQDQENCHSAIEAFAKKHKIDLVAWSKTNIKAALYISEIVKTQKVARIQAVYQDQKLFFTIPFTDDASIENALHASLAALVCGAEPGSVQNNMERLEPVAMRLEMKEGRQGNIIINDAYNSDLESLPVALDFLDQQSGDRKKVLILSDILQSGLDNTQLYREVERIVKAHSIDELVTIGPKTQSYNWSLKISIRSFGSTAQFLKEAYGLKYHDSALMLKGARVFEFEKIGKWFEEKSHQTVMEIRLENVVHNLNYFRAKLKPGVKMMAMVKAFSYGSGAYQIASLLEFHKLDYLAVAYTDEGVELRKAGVNLPIMVLNAEPSAFKELIHYRLEPEIYSLAQLKVLVQTLSLEGANHGFPIHLKMETGMNRLGFEDFDLEDLMQFLENHNEVKVSSVFSHLASSDDEKLRAFSLIQIQRFEKMCALLKSVLNISFTQHLLNSSGINNFPDQQYDMVRLGIGLYGVSSDNNERQHLRHVSVLKAHVSQIKYVSVGESVGYNRAFVAEKATKIAVISIGYADGFRRSLGNGVGEVVIRNARYRVVGNVCMDMTMIDVSGSDVEAGDAVEIFGDNLSVYEVASKMQTIPYEVLTSISQRVKRVYVME